MDILLIIIIAVAGPVIGSFIGVIRKPTDIFVNNFLSFAAGIMLAISFLQLIPQSIRISSLWLCCLGIVIGSLFMYALDKVVPHTDPADIDVRSGRFRKTAIYLIAGIALHHFPEGAAIALGTVTGYETSLAIVLAIAVHDIPEGICTSAPYFYITQSRLKSFLVSSSTAIPTILGYLVAHFMFEKISFEIIGFVVASTAGLMVYISADELIPISCRKSSSSENHSTIFSLIAGVVLVVLLGAISK